MNTNQMLGYGGTGLNTLAQILGNVENAKPVTGLAGVAAGTAISVTGWLPGWNLGGVVVYNGSGVPLAPQPSYIVTLPVGSTAGKITFPNANTTGDTINVALIPQTIPAAAYNSTVGKGGVQNNAVPAPAQTNPSGLQLDETWKTNAVPTPTLLANALPVAAFTSVAQGSYLLAPVANAPTTATTGGTLAAGPYFYKVTAVNANGETVGSNEGTVTTTGTTSANTITWAAVTGATSYNVYRGTAAGGESVKFVLGNVLTFTDTGAAGVAGTVPAAGTAFTGNPLEYVFTNASTDTGASISEYSWDFGDGVGVSVAQNPTYTYTAAGTYTVTLQITDAAGNSATKSAQVVVA